MEFDVAIVDEAHFYVIGNLNNQKLSLIDNLKVKYALTGTPAVKHGS
jgi:hypothetical protein